MTGPSFNFGVVEPSPRERPRQTTRSSTQEKNKIWSSHPYANTCLLSLSIPRQNWYDMSKRFYLRVQITQLISVFVLSWFLSFCELFIGIFQQVPVDWAQYIASLQLYYWFHLLFHLIFLGSVTLFWYFSSCCYLSNLEIWINCFFFVRPMFLHCMIW